MAARIYTVHMDRTAAEHLALQKHPDVLYIGDWPQGQEPGPRTLRSDHQRPAAPPPKPAGPTP